jgi:ribosomal protein S18 acetylase RimI-like enzyme
MPVRVHQLRPADWKRFRHVRLSALADAPNAFGSTLEAEEQLSDDEWIERLERQDAATFVAVDDGGSDCGLIVGAPYGDQAGLYAMWVASSARRLGVGAMLVYSVIEWSRSREFERLLLDVSDTNEGAIALYSRMGFQPTGKTGTLPEPRQNVLEHQRALSLKKEGEQCGGGQAATRAEST